jgi:hypothetical protein
MSSTVLRRAASVILTATAALTLTACGNSVDEAQNNASAPTLPSVQSEEEANASADARAAAEAAASKAAKSSGPKTNERGNIVKTLGEEGGVISEDGTSLYTFAFDSIAPDVPCTDEYSTYDPENGHLVAVQMRVATAAVNADELGYLTVGAHDFKFIGSDGLTFTNVDTIATYGCISDSLKFPSDQLRPGSQYAGVVLLDLPATSGTLIYQPSSLSEGGWEISF